ncbi:MAG TPA: family 1 glycosylhydrolase, partial [Myxococcales bacterium]|nr:family 1 glycosylhydrolase [Myxococcales bacterium]
PRWVAAGGGWQSDRILDLFEAYVRRLADAFGSLPHLWCTINEPTIVAIQGYLRGIWPPGLQDQVVAAQVLARLMRAHARAARVLRERTGRPAGVAHHVRVFQPARLNPVDWVVASIIDQFANQAVLDCHRTGRIQLMIPGQISIDEAVPDLKGSFDYVGLNYYTRDHVQADFKDPSMSRQFVPEGRPRNDLGWEIYPEGLYQVLARWGRIGLPLYVTENGIPDAGGKVRPDFLRRHLYAIEKAVRNGADVRGYFHWSLLDNFEWAEGLTPRFGLFRVDYDDPQRKRTATPAVAVFQDLARRLGAAQKG